MVSYNFISYLGIKVQRGEIMDMATMGCNSIDGISGITNHNNYCGAYCMGLGTSVSFLRWYTFINWIVRLTT